MFTLKLENDRHNEVDLNDQVNYVIVSVDGLNPPSASLFTSKSPNRKGVKYHGSTVNERNVLITIKILGDVEKNRNELYRWTDTESYVKIKYANGLKNVYCEGHVEECDVDLFTNNEVMTLSIVCEDPYWKDLNEIKTEISSILKQFTFAFAIDSDGIPFSTIRETNETFVFNGGAETGCEFTIKCLGEVENLTIYNSTDTSKRLEIYTRLEKGWVVKIDTYGSPKTIKAYKPDGSVENLLKYVGHNPTWFTIKRGNNSFGYSVGNGSNESDIELSVGFTNKYLGV